MCLYESALPDPSLTVSVRVFTPPRPVVHTVSVDGRMQVRDAADGCEPHPSSLPRPVALTVSVDGRMEVRDVSV